MKKLTLFLLASILLLADMANAQSPCCFNLKKELALTAGVAASVGLGLYLKSRTAPLTTSEWMALDRNDVNPFDRFAIDNNSLAAHNLSNYFWYGSFALPPLLLAGKETRNDAGIITLMWGETVLLNSGLTLLAKFAFKRARPFTYDPNADVEMKETFNAKTSFFSGHVSMTAANTFFAAKVYSDYYPDSKWKPIVWGTAITIPAITSYLRVRAGRHFLTDVMAGYAVGAAVGYLVPHFHKNRKPDKDLSFYGGLNGFALDWRF